MALIERLARRLESAAAERGLNAGSTLTIGEVYQELIPYRGVRTDLGVFELAEYEHALLRLLRGEGGILRLRDDEVRRELSSELGSPNPILGIYRDYASREVELVGHPPAADPARRASDGEGAVSRTGIDAAARSRGGPADPAPPPDSHPRDPHPDPAALETPEPLPELAYPPPAPFPADATRVARAASVPSEFAPPSHGGADRCVGCGEPLPDVEGLRFCPHCGADQREVSCARCGSALRPEWTFCVRCGAHRAAGPPSA